MQVQSLRRCVREQDLMLEVALHKLELHGGGEMAQALSTQLSSLRASVGPVLHDDEPPPPQRKGGKGDAAWSDALRSGPPAAVASAMREVSKFFDAAGSAGNDALRKSDAAIADVSRRAAPEVERLGGMAKSVLEHTMGRIAAATKQATTPLSS